MTVKTQPIAATKVGDIDKCGNVPGAIEVREPHGIEYICPCGCGRHGWLAFRPAVSPSWSWNAETVTLHPSVHHVGHWHGWLRNGIWESC